ncbi:hypothetical protein DJ68_14570 [Halorubrum sp. C3]|nr:hypothetical protein DJ68_14570 [Halorubrum sp. C3]
MEGAMCELQQCEVCGGEKPAELIDHTTVETIAPLEADICQSCQHVQNHELPEDGCMKCGRDLEDSFYMEVEFPLGPEDLPARLSGSLCGDCAGWVGTEINYEAIDADEEAFQELIRLLDKQHELKPDPSDDGTAEVERGDV